MLSANLDALFDVGLISFGDDGTMMVADVLTQPERVALSIPSSLTRKPNAKLKGYLQFHREHVFQGR
ncbi:hypothetical protein [Frateuria soli]|uniref:hypothetical protein n=1 Tax=Frateuria soli TaxID=1542730 RepID=UPI001E2BE35C|nr:hypothetical protein [Frateuria soli]UGB36870.1 hypothetical protein LQ771_08425 [Frateuria soli]